MPQYMLMYAALLLYSGIISLGLVSEALNVTGVTEKSNLCFVGFPFYFHEASQMGI